MLQSPIVDINGTHFEAPVSASANGWDNYSHDGEKYPGGLGPVPIMFTDYYALRQRSATFFKTNLYARGVIRRLVTNVINTGLSLEADPTVGLIPLGEDAAGDWSIDVEDKFKAWSDLPQACDFSSMIPFGEIERTAFREALIEGDVLIIEHHNEKTQLPCYELVNGALITSPLDYTSAAKGHKIEYGVELNAKREHVAFHIVQSNLEHKRVPAIGRNGRRLAWLYYATDKRHGDVRGEPLLSLIMQSVGEIDKYRDSTQRKATINAMLAMFFYQTADSKVPNSRPITAGAQRRVVGTAPAGDGGDVSVNMASTTPGIVYETLPAGMEPKGFSSDGTDEKFGEFESAVLSGIAWALEIPLSVLKMAFSNSYSASRGEIKEFNMYLGVARNRFADTFTRIVYRSWLIAMALTRRINAPGMLEAWRDPMSFDAYAAWTASNWFGAVKEAVDVPKEVNGHILMAENAYTTNSVASRQLTGTRFHTNVKRVARENKLKADAMRPMLELSKEFGTDAVQAMSHEQTLRLVDNTGESIDV